MVDTSNNILVSCVEYDPDYKNTATHGLWYEVAAGQDYAVEFFITGDAFNGANNWIYDPNVPPCTGSAPLPANHR